MWHPRQDDVAFCLLQLLENIDETLKCAFYRVHISLLAAGTEFNVLSLTCLVNLTTLFSAKRNFPSFLDNALYVSDNDFKPWYEKHRIVVLFK